MVVGQFTIDVDVLVLGAGPGGYVAAIRAAQLGKEVAVIDGRAPGGVCLHQGCIPSKALLSAAGQVWQARHLNKIGVTACEITIDMAKMQQWKNGVVQRLSQGVEKLFKGHNVQWVQGYGRFIDKNRVHVAEEHTTTEYRFKQCIIATGGSPAALPGLPFDGKRVLTAEQALELEQLPEAIAIIGADYIAAELATLFIKLGSAVRLLIPKDEQFIGEFDLAAARQVQAALRKLGVKIERDVSDPVAAVAEAELVAVSAGIIPNTADLDLKSAGVTTDEQGFIVVNSYMRTSNSAIYAVGDVIGGPSLATLAIKQGKVAAEHLAGLPVEYAPQAVPRIAWTDPEIATVGLSADEAEDAGYEVVEGRFPLGANGRALTMNSNTGVVLTVAEQGSELLLGVTIVAPHASDLIGEAALALEMGATLTDLAETMHPHPSLGETIQESVESALSKAVHILG